MQLQLALVAMPEAEATNAAHEGQRQAVYTLSQLHLYDWLAGNAAFAAVLLAIGLGAVVEWKSSRRTAPSRCCLLDDRRDPFAPEGQAGVADRDERAAVGLDAEAGWAVAAATEP